MKFSNILEDLTDNILFRVSVYTCGFNFFVQKSADKLNRSPTLTSEVPLRQGKCRNTGSRTVRTVKLMKIIKSEKSPETRN